VRQNPETERARRTLVGGAVVAAAGLLAALALVYTNSSGIGSVAAEAQLQQQTEAALGAASSARNALGQALLLSGFPGDPTVGAAAISEATAITDALEDRITLVAEGFDDSTGLVADLSAAVSSTRAALNAAAAGDLETASAIATGDATKAYELLVDDLIEIRDGLATSIASAAAESGKVATASRFMVAFVVPTIAVAVTFIVSRRRRKREHLTRELAHERTLNKSKDQLIANLSHELRTPLTGIYTSALTIEEVGFSDAELAMELTDVIIDQSADLTRMVEDLLASAQADAGRLRFDLKATSIHDVTGTLQKEFERLPTQITWSVTEGEVIADAGRLRQLMRNLISNASKYGDGVVSITGRSEREYYVIEVTDNGPGVSPDLEERMFQRFIHRGDAPLVLGSVGLGLSISKVLAEGMNGLLMYHRRDNHTVFEITLRLIGTEEPLDPNPTEAPTLTEEHAPTEVQ
jgi:K+-sensing histidine kinase KdpD